MARSRYKNTSAFGIIFLVVVLGAVIYYLGFMGGFTHIRNFITTHIPFAK